MDVQDHERGQSGEGVEALTDLLIEPVVDVEGDLDGIRVERCLPDVEAPGLIRTGIDRLGPGPVQVDLESRSVHHDSERNDIGEDIRVGIFFPKPNLLVESDAFGDVRSEAVTGVDGRRQDRTDVIEHHERGIHGFWYPTVVRAKHLSGATKPCQGTVLSRRNGD